MHVLYLLIFKYLTGLPTLRQQAELFIRSLRLGTNADEPTDNSATTPTTQPPPRTTQPPPRTTQPLPRTIQSPPWITWPLSRTTRTIQPPPCNMTFNPYRGCCDISLGSYYCPSHENQTNNRICPNVCSTGMYVRLDWSIIRDSGSYVYMISWRLIATRWYQMRAQMHRIESRVTYSSWTNLVQNVSATEALISW